MECNYSALVNHGATRDCTTYGMPLTDDCYTLKRKAMKRYNEKKIGRIRANGDTVSKLEPLAKEFIRHVIAHGYIETRVISARAKGRQGAVVDLMTDLAPIYQDTYDIPCSSAWYSRIAKDQLERVYYAINWDFVRDKEAFIARFKEDGL